MTVSVRPWAEIAADLREWADDCDDPEFPDETPIHREAAVAGDALAAENTELMAREEGDKAYIELLRQKLRERDALAAEVARLTMNNAELREIHDLMQADLNDQLARVDALAAEVAKLTALIHIQEQAFDSVVAAVTALDQLDRDVDVREWAFAAESFVSAIAKAVRP